MSDQLIREAFELAKGSPLSRLPYNEFSELALIVDHEAEGWDGEPITASFLLYVMQWRYECVGLTPSRN